MVVTVTLSVFAGEGGVSMLFTWKLNWELVTAENRELTVTSLLAGLPEHVIDGCKEEEHVIEDEIPNDWAARSPVQ